MFDNEIDDEIIAHDMDEYFSNVIAPYLDEWQGEKIIDENKKKFYDNAEVFNNTELESSADFHCYFNSEIENRQPSSSERKKG